MKDSGKGRTVRRLKTRKLSMSQIRSQLTSLAFTFSVVFGYGAAAQSLAGKTLRIVVPFPPGGPSDVLARLLGQQVGQMSGKTVIVENRPGAGSIIGTEAVARALPDGSTLLVSGTAFVINASLRPNLPYD